MFSLLTSWETVSNLHRKYCHLLILHSLDWLAAFHLGLLQAILFIAPVWGCQLSSIGRLFTWRIGERSLDKDGSGEIKYPGRIWKLTYDGLPRGNQNLSRSGKCKWKVALAKLTTCRDDVNRYSYMSETEGQKWEPSCRLLHCDVEGKEKPPHRDLKPPHHDLKPPHHCLKPPHHDLKAATKVLYLSN